MEPTPDEQPTGDMPPAVADEASSVRRSQSASPASEYVAGQQIGTYKLLTRIGEGGFGEVWLAERREPFVQRVALKLIKAGMDSRLVVARFEQERQALAVMNHPSIARVFDGGLTPQGRPYFAMEYVKGEPITTFCDSRRLDLRQRLELFVQACEAVQHAHMKGVVHRDIKPSNVLAFASEGAAPKLKVIDFGLAKVVSGPLTDLSIFTETGQMIGTPAYMSPEQTDPSAVDIDTRSDVYSLGVLLYELVTGATPFDAKVLRQKAYGEIQRIIREDDPPTPSARLSTIWTKDAALASRIQRARGVALKDLARALRSELEWIPLKAMRKEPSARYQSASDFAADLVAYLEGRPIMAAPESAGYRLRKYIRRNRGFVVAAVLVAAALVSGIVGTGYKWREAEAARLQALSAQEEAAASAVAEREAREAFAISRERIGLLGAAITADSALRAAQTAEYDQLESNLEVAEEFGAGDRFDVGLARSLFEQSIHGPRDGHMGSVRQVGFCADGALIFSLGKEDRRMRCWDGAGFNLASEPLFGTGDYLGASSDGAILGSVSEQERVLQLWEARTGKPIGMPLQQEKLGFARLAFSPDGKTLATAGWDGSVRLWEIATGRPIGEPLVGHEGNVDALAFSPDGKTLASVGWDQTVRLWESATGRPRGEAIRGLRGVRSVAFSPSGSTMALGSQAGLIYILGLEESAPSIPPLRGGDAAVTSLSFRSDGMQLLSGGEDGTVRLWDLATGVPVDGGDWDELRSFAISPDGSTIVGLIDAIDSSAHVLRLWDTRTRRRIGAEVRLSVGGLFGVAISPDGSLLAVWGGDDAGGRLELWDLALGQSRDDLAVKHAGSIGCVAFSPDGTLLASGGDDGTIQLWETRSLHPMGERLRGHLESVKSIAFAPDSRTLVSGGADGTVRLWEAMSGRLVGEPLRSHIGSVNEVAFSPDGRVLASGGDDGVVRLWDIGSDRPTSKPLLGRMQEVYSVAFSSDGKVLAGGGAAVDFEGGLVRLWDVATGFPIGEPLGPYDYGAVAEFSPDGAVLVSADWRRLVFWDSVPMRDRASAIRSRLAELDAVRSALAVDIEDIGRSRSALEALDRRVRIDPRFAGELRRSALIVVAEAESQQQAASDSFLDLIYSLNGDLERLLALLVEADAEELGRLNAYFLGHTAWRALTELRDSSSARDPERILTYAKLARSGTRIPNPPLLITLARAYWEVGDKANAIAVQRELLELDRLNVRLKSSIDGFASMSIDEVRATLERYEREEPPRFLRQSPE